MEPFPWITGCKDFCDTIATLSGKCIDFWRIMKGMERIHSIICHICRIGPYRDSADAPVPPTPRYPATIWSGVTGILSQQCFPKFHLRVHQMIMVAKSTHNIGSTFVQDTDRVAIKIAPGRRRQ
jgi:hypothetical protein